MATGSIGGINVKINADTSGFMAGLNRVEARLAKVGAKVRENGKAFASWSTVGAIAAGAVATAMVKSSMTQLDALAKTADALKINQKALQSLQHVAELNGTTANQLATNLERMQRRIGEIARKGGQAAQALDEIGLSAKDMIALSADKQLEQIAAAMSGIDNASVRASIAMDLFGRDGVRMLKMLESLSTNGLQPTVDDLEKMGVLLSRVDTAKVEAANDAMFKASEALGGVVNKIAVEFSPLIEAISNQISDAAKETGGFKDAIDSTFSGAVKSAAFFADALHGLDVVFSGLKVAAMSISAAFYEALRIMTAGFEQFVNMSISGLNGIISTVNKIPGVAIPSIEAFTFGAAKLFTDLSTIAGDNLTGAIDEFQRKAMEPMPSEALNAWVKEVQEASQAAAEAATSSTGEEGAGVGLTEDQKRSLQERVKAIRQSLLSESQAKTEAYLADLETLKEALENEQITKAQYEQLERDRKSQHEEELTNIEKNAADARMRLAQAESQAKLNALRGAFSNLSALMNTESRKMFEIGKVAAISGAIVDGIAATVGAFKVGNKLGGPVVGAAYAATAAAGAYAQVQQIRNTKYGSASTGQSYSGGTVATNTTQQEPQTTVVDLRVTGPDNGIVSMFNFEVANGAQPMLGGG